MLDGVVVIVVGVNVFIRFVVVMINLMIKIGGFVTKFAATFLIFFTISIESISLGR